ncbi:L,D-transpeptidase family protein [Collinsella provencensis]|uniref:L,D-transpeptidase family protein n=1 Tax=Collinsella provencensis TaxID=1937461 RepID=UPI000C81DC9C|nr:L,D-transpeptidase family protein [Collinsella provencensis]
MTSNPDGLPQNDSNPYASGSQQPVSVISADQPTTVAPQTISEAHAAPSGAGANAKTSQQKKNGESGAHFSFEPERRPKKPLIILGVIAALLIAAYGGGVYAFSSVCYPNTTIAGVDVSLMTRDDAVQQVKASAKSYKLTVEGEGFSWTYTPDSLANIFDAQAAVDQTLEANEPWTWPFRVTQAFLNQDEAAATNAEDLDTINVNELEFPDSFDREAFSTSLKAAVDEFNATHPGTFDAVGAYDAEAHKFTLEQAHANQQLDFEPIEKAALVALSRLTGSVELDESCRIPLAEDATDEQLQAALDKANDLIGTDVDLTMGGNTVATLDGAQLATWITFDDNLTPALDTEMVTTWAHDLATNTLDTVGTKRTYTRPDGKQVEVEGGTYGWISDEEQLIALVQNAVEQKQTGTLEVPTKRTADTFNGAGGRDWGAYVDVDLSEQYARFYDASDNVIWETHVISGNVNLGRGTPSGVYMLNNKARNVTLIGADEDHDDEPDYKTPVAYWMPFVGGAVGLHDANWQSDAAFADPNAYTYRGSHGCVNLPTSKAAELYDMISVGTCVIVHW